MGRVSDIDKKKLVEYNEKTRLSKCLLCEKRLKGYILGNIKRHYEKIHKYNFDNIVSSKSEHNVFKRRISNQSGSKLNKLDFVKCCVGMVTVKNIPFRIFDDRAYFKKLIQPYEKQYNLKLNSKNIVTHINQFANDIKTLLKQSFSKKMLSLKADVTTRMGKIILGINVQYIDDFKIVINTIGMIELKNAHTPHSLKEEILKCLHEFDIEPTQIYSITTGNDANIFKASKLLEQHLQNEEFVTTTSEYDQNDDKEFIYDRLNSVHAILRCAAHTIQLTADDVFKQLQNKLEECRRIVMLLRASDKKSIELRLPPIDNTIRWNTTFEMMETLLCFKNHINGNETSLFIDCEIDWNFIENFVSVFEPLVQCSKELQAEQYIIGDFYRDWLVCEAKYKKMCKNSLAILLLESMSKRKEELLDNVAFTSGIYFDPRFNFLDSPFINDDQRKSAVVHILKTNGTLNSLNSEVNSSKFSEIIEPQIDEPVSPNDPYNILEEELNHLTSKRLITENSPNIRQKLNNLAYGKRMPFATNILDYWKIFSIKERDLFKLAEVVLAAPPSQVSLVRAFRALSTIITKERSRLSCDTLNHSLIVKLNKDLLQKVNL